MCSRGVVVAFIQFTVSVLIHTATVIRCSGTHKATLFVFICTMKLLSWLTVSTLFFFPSSPFFSPASPPSSLLLCPSASRWRSPSPSAASVWGPRSRIAIRSQRSSSPAPTVATVVSAAYKTLHYSGFVERTDTAQEEPISCLQKHPCNWWWHIKEVILKKHAFRLIDWGFKIWWDLRKM